ncbi:unnamed protein product [marine sediment metagenome]|uniref:Uncharacterized protein n=1 Tax=marine sediment metagenome TaxID=412755 RepID=X0T254_9ZZZZ
MSEGVYSAVPQPMKFAQIGLIYIFPWDLGETVRSHPTAEACGISRSIC